MLRRHSSHFVPFSSIVESSAVNNRRTQWSVCYYYLNILSWLMILDQRQKAKWRKKNFLSWMFQLMTLSQLFFYYHFLRVLPRQQFMRRFFAFFFLFNDLRNVSCGGDYMWADFPFEKIHFHLQERVVTDTEQQYTNNDGGRCRQRRLYIEQTDAATDKTTGACICA